VATKLRKHGHKIEYPSRHCSIMQKRGKHKTPKERFKDQLTSGGLKTRHNTLPFRIHYDDGSGSDHNDTGICFIVVKATRA